MRVLPFGDRALLAEYDDLAETLSAYRALDRARPAGVVELVPAARTVLVRLDGSVGLAAATRWIEGVHPDPVGAVSGPLVTIDVTYDGPDLEATASTLGITVGELVHRHSSAEWTSAFIGFAPGFAYLTSPGLDLAVPRRSTSRERVRAGSVALAGAFTGVYPRDSPGGWQLIGRTDAELWNLDRDPPALLAPGTRVRFEVRA